MDWQIVFAVLAGATMLLGNLVALPQKNTKRLMAYSSIAHAGFILAGIAAMGPNSLLVVNGILYYLIGYSVTNLLVFGALISFFNSTGQDDISDLAGLADRQPFLAASIAIGLFSLAGLPIFVGFTIKFYLFTAVAQAGLLWLAGVAIFSSLISLYYYLNVIRVMYIESIPVRTEGATDTEEISSHSIKQIPRPSIPLLTVIGISLVAVVWLGVYPGPLLEGVELASQAILTGG